MKNKIIELLKNNLTLEEISMQLFNTKTTARINKLINEYKIDLSIYPLYKYKDKEWLSKQFDLYKTPSEVSKQTGLPRTSITRYALKFNLYTSKFKRKKKNEINENYFEKIDTPEKAYWLGFIMADGCIYHYKDSDKVQFEIKIKSTDGKHLERFAKSIDFDISKIKYGEAKRKNTVCKYAKIRTYNKTFCENLIKHGIFDQKSGKEIFPKMPEEFKRDFIRGFIDGDGSIMIDNNSGVYIYSTSEKIIDEILFFLQSKNFVMYKRTAVYNTYTMYSLRSSKKNNNLKNLLEYLYYDNCIALTRKLKRANILKNRPSI